MKLFLKRLRNFFNLNTEPPEVYSFKKAIAVMRGYEKLRNAKKNSFVKEIYEEITLTKIGSTLFYFNVLNKSSYFKEIEIAFRQYLIFNLIGTRLSASILANISNNKPLVFPMPVEWARVLKKKNINVSICKSNLLYLIFALKQLISSVVFFFNVIFDNIFNKSNKSKSNFIYILYLTKNCFPPENGSFHYNIIDWYINWGAKIKNLDEIQHDLQINSYIHRDINIKYSPLMPKIKSVKYFIIFIIFGFLNIFLSILNLFAGKLNNAIFLKEILKSKLFDMAETSELAKEYLFNNENMKYRPFWTYSAEMKGSKITLYNWSAGFADFLGYQGYPPTGLGEKIQNWPTILQWSEPYANYLQTIILSNKTKIRLVPPIYYSDVDSPINKFEKPVILIFDVTPQKKYFHDILTPYVEYRTFSIGKKFLEDIYFVAKKCNFDILWKRKRAFHSNHSKSYIKFCNIYSQLPGVIEVDPGISAFRLVQEADIVISMPFTSTGIVAASFKKPSIYFDPVNILFKGDRGAQGIPLISGKAELEDWIKKL